ncbi:MAG: hypothetical protein K0U24_07275 [Gammaproteobacteria bacterium]|nr:hypothetical protein [Gammaproteobacteria bacterium]MCH9764003.1 hypothetical protein [Gammaproteobacteria bacterium]
MKKQNILFLADTTHQAGAVRDHIHAVTASDAFHWHILNPLMFKLFDKIDFSLFDAVGIHFSIKLHGYYYLSPALKKKIRYYQGPKFVFLQDEYQKVNHTQALLYQLGCHVLFTLVRPELWHQAYPDKRLKKLKKIQVLTGYVDDSMHTLKAPEIASRPLNISYRTRRCDYRLGKLAQEKTQIAFEFTERTKNTALSLDVSIEESDRVYGEAWFNLLMQSKVVLGTESGASIWDIDGRISKKINHYLRKHQGASFDTVFEAVLKPYEGNLVYSAISPRVFEAAATKTAMVMFVGYYNGVCQQDVHYIGLEKDFSNFQEVLDKIQDDVYLQKMVDRTYDDLIASGRYAQSTLSDLVLDELKCLINKTAVASSKSDLSKQYEAAVIKHKFLNQFRCFYTELAFVASNFFRLLFLEPSGTWLSKLRLLAEGAKRYFTYLNPRMKKNRT